MQGRPPWFLLLKYRRGGFTTLEQGQSYRYTRDNPDTNALSLAHTKSDTAKIFRISLLFHERDPNARILKNTGNAHRLEYIDNGSVYETATAGGAGPGVGSTLQRVHWSEVSNSCLGPNQIDKQRNVLSGLTEAASHGEIVLETTPKGMELFCELYRDAKAGRNDWTPIFLPWFHDRDNTESVTAIDIEELRDTLGERDRTFMSNLSLSWGQMKWRRMKQRMLKQLFPQEYPEDDDTCFLTSGVRFFDTDLIIRLLYEVAESNKRHLPGGYECVWEEPKPGMKYVLGVDTSEGIVGGDPNGVGVLRFDNCKQVAAVHGLFRPSVLAEHTIRLHRKYNRAFVGIERENHGHAVLERLNPIDPSDMFHFKPGRMGWSTNLETRPVMLDDLADALDEGYMKVMDRDMVSEMGTFGLQSAGKWASDSGAHDDCLFKWAVALQMRKWVAVHRASNQVVIVQQG